MRPSAFHLIRATLATALVLTAAQVPGSAAQVETGFKSLASTPWRSASTGWQVLADRDTPIRDKIASLTWGTGRQIPAATEGPASKISWPERGTGAVYTILKRTL